MFEVTLLLLAMLLIAACAFLPMGCNMLFSPKSPQQCDADSNSGLDSGLRIVEDSAAKQTFLSHLQSEIESALFPRPTDCILRRHYDALVNAEVENRLAAMPDS
jgi:hypothetical protein